MVTTTTTTQNSAANQAETPPTVLIVDDEETIRVALARGLKRLGCEIIEARDGESGLSMVTARKPQIIFLDLRMPGIDGHTFLKRLASLDSQACVVVMSGQGKMDDVVQVLRAGAVDYMKKPWSPAELISAYNRGLETAAARAKLRAQRDGARAPGAPAAAASPAAAGPVSPQTAWFQQMLIRVRAGELPVPPVPGVLLSLRSMLQSDQTDVDEVVTKIEADQRLAADLVRLSNTPQYARGGRNTSVKAAVTRLGLRPVHGLVETLALKGSYQSGDPQTRRLLARVWGHGVARGLAMRALADLMASDDRINPDSAYLNGLMADVGACFLLWVVAQRGEPLTTADEAWLLPSIAQHHSDLSALILRRWGFDDESVKLAQHHHADAAPVGSGRYWPMGVLAAGLASEVTGEPDITQARPIPDALRERCAAELELGDLLPRLAEQLKKEYLALVDILQA
jgi:HD-like signal output (HDOD) protein/CheY-like chemotaxis protein